MFIKAMLLIATAAGTSLFLGPPTIEVTTSNQPDGILATIEAHYHTEATEVRVYGTAYTWSGNRRGERTVLLERLDEHHYRVPRAAIDNDARVLVVGVEQGVAGKHGAAEALLRIDRAGNVRVDIAKTRPILGNPMPRRVNAREIEEALSILRAD